MIRATAWGTRYTPWGKSQAPKGANLLPPFANGGSDARFTPVAQATPPPNVRLRRAIDASDYSIRSLSFALAERDDVPASAESIRRSLGRMLSGRDQITDRWAAILERQLSLEAGVLREPNYSRPISLARELVRRLDAGESFAPEDLLRAAESVEAASVAAHRLAVRLQREASGRGRRGSSLQ